MTMRKRRKSEGGSTRVPKRGEVAKGLEPRQEAILAAPCNNEPRQALQTPANGTLGYIKRPIASARSRDRAFLLAASEETGAIHPFRLDEFKLAPQMGADKGEHQAAINTVVIEDAVRKWRTVGGSATNHPVDANHTCNIRVAGIHPTDVGTARCLVANRVVLLEKEGVVLSWVGSHFRIIVQWSSIPTGRIQTGAPNGRRQRRTSSRDSSQLPGPQG